MVDHLQLQAPTSSIKNYLSELPKARNHLIITFVKIVVDQEPIGLLHRHTYATRQVSRTFISQTFRTIETIQLSVLFEN